MIYIKQHISYALSAIVLLFANQAMAGGFYFSIEGAKVSSYESTKIKAFKPSTMGVTLGYSFESIKNLSFDTNYTDTFVGLDSMVKNNKVKLKYRHFLYSLRYTYPISRKISVAAGAGYLSYGISGLYAPTSTGTVSGGLLKQTPAKGSVLLAYQFAIQAKTTKQTAVFVKYNYIGAHKTATEGVNKEKRKIPGLGLGDARSFGLFIVGATYTF